MTRLARFRLGSLLLAGLVAGCATDREVRSQADAAHAELEPAILQDAELRGYLVEVGDRIVAAAQEMDRQGRGPKSHFSETNEWMFSEEQFHLVNSEVLNAFTTGGEHMYIFSELMRECRSEDELAAVMAHEYGHVYARHVHSGMDRQTIVMLSAVGLGAAGYALGEGEERLDYAVFGAGLGLVAGQFLSLGFTREDEAEADALGFDFYVRAGWDPDRFGDFFQQLIDRGFDKTPEWQSDHPSLASRVSAARARAQRLPPEAASWRRPPVADATRFAALRERAREVGASMPTESQAMQRAVLLLNSVPSCLLPADQPEQRRAQAILVQAQEAEGR